MNVLHKAARLGDLEAIEHMKKLPYFKDIVNVKDPVTQWTPILHATKSMNLEAVKALIHAGANPLISNSDGINTIHLSASQNDVWTLDYIIRKMQKG
jgi:ankyrin repeat protein